MYLTRHVFRGLVFILFILHFSPARAQVTIQIDADAYLGSWSVLGVPGEKSGSMPIDLNPGTHTMQVGGSTEGRFNFDVDAGGVVTSNKPTSATGSASTLTFRTTPITIDPAAYAGSRHGWSILSVTREESGLKNIVVVPDLGYLMTVGSGVQGRFGFDVDAGGGVKSNRPTSATGSGNTLTFKTATITIDPAAYTGSRHGWSILSVTREESGLKNIVVVPDLGYLMTVGSTVQGRFSFDVDAGGLVTSNRPTSATGSSSTLTFNTTPITIDPNTYQGSWSILSVTREESGLKNIVLVPDLGYLLIIGSIAANRFTFIVDPDGVPDPPNIPVTINGETFTFLLAKTAPPELATIGDSFLRRGPKNRNEGANPILRVRKAGKNRALVKFDAAEISNFGTISKATLRLNIAGIGNNWGTGRTVDAHPLNVEFAEGNGKAAGVPGSERTRGTGQGTTWKCAIDTDISNRKTNCSPRWRGGDFRGATAAGVTHINGQTGAVEWDVTADVRAGTTGWLIRKTREGRNGKVLYYSREGAAAAGDSSLAPTLILK